MTKMQQIPNVPHENTDIDISRLLAIMLDNKWLILSVAFLFFLGGAVYAFMSKPVYRGDALVQIEKRSSVNPLGDLKTVMGEEKKSSSVEVEILRSRMVLGRVVDQMNLDTIVVPHTLPLVGKYVQRKNISRPSTSSIPALNKFLERYSDYLPFSNEIEASVWGGESINVGLFSVEDALRGRSLTLKSLGQDGYQLLLGDELLGKGVAGEKASFMEGAIELRVAEMVAPEGAEFTLTKALRSVAIQSLASRLSVAETGSGFVGNAGMLRLTLTGTDREEIRRLLDAISENFLMQNVERQSAQVDQSLAFIDEQAPELRTQLSSAEDKLNEYRVKMDSVDLDSESQSVIAQLIDVEKKLSEVEFQEAEMAQRFTRNHPAYQALIRQKSFLRNERDRLNARVEKMPAAQQEVVRLTRDVEVTQAIYVNLINRYQELRLAKAGTIGNVRIIDSAQVSPSPITPKKMLIIMSATLLGATLSIGVVLLRAFVNRGVEVPEQLESIGLPVYATVPLSDDQLKLVRKSRSHSRNGNVIKGILSAESPTDIAIEALRGLRTSLHFAMMESKNKCIMICGPSPEVGKSFVAMNLAAVCAQAGNRVLLIDADMRKGNIHKAFGGHSAEGLSDFLSGKVEWKKLVRDTSIEGLSYVSRGLVPPNPSELLMQDRFGSFLEDAGKDYDLIVIDTPPVLAVTDSVIVGKKTGTSLMVARYRHNSPKEIKLALRRFETSGVEVRGFILNALEGKARINYGYYNYAYK
ncbi:tyrosine-protein kinase Etk/Wzc [Onishia taeanensis]|uniref:Tyrosine-protein kinase Etk/Wzc n=2 Tax=Onishia taeanensis TaxID=284577 RepID=A0A328XSK7_9GAMM|nr:tyrosine-protein kinase Etk/Wzc [Halomonas taeanensis]